MWALMVKEWNPIRTKPDGPRVTSSIFASLIFPSSSSGSNFKSFLFVETFKDYRAVLRSASCIGCQYSEVFSSRSNALFPPESPYTKLLPLQCSYLRLNLCPESFLSAESRPYSRLFHTSGPSEMLKTPSKERCWRFSSYIAVGPT